MKKLVIRMTNGDELISNELISSDASFEELVNAVNSKPMPKFLTLGKQGCQYLVNVKQIAYAKEVEE